MKPALVISVLSYLAARPQMPRGNLFAKNLLVNSKLTEEKGVTAENNRSVTQNPGLENVGIPGFEPIPFDIMRRAEPRPREPGPSCSV